MPNQFGGVGKGEAFALSLLGSTMGAFKSDYDKRQSETNQQQELDYEIVMKAINDPEWVRTHTPSQREYAIEKAVDLLKPKNAQGIKEQLKQLFGKAVPYTPQAGNVLREAGQKPRADVQGSVAGGPTGQTPSTFSNTGVTLPPPPEMPYKITGGEKTFGEMDIEDLTIKQDLITTRQLAVTEANNQARQKRQDDQQAAVLDRIGLRDNLRAKHNISARAWEINPTQGPADPNAFALAAQSFIDERKQKAEMNDMRMKQIQESMATADERLKVAQGHLSLAQRREGRMSSQETGKKDPQVAQAWNKVQEANKAALTSRQQYGIKLAEGDTKGAETFLKLAERYEAEAQSITNNIETMQQQRQGVQLPPPPGARPQFNLRQWKADHPNATEAEINAKRQKFKGYLIIE